jgi:hypothetical protein
MTTITRTGADLSFDGPPAWQPLIDLVGDTLVEFFMWMHEVELDDGTRVHAYKHRETRRYAHLDEDGGAWDYRAAWDRDDAARYIALPPAYALAGALWTWPITGAEPEDLAEVERVLIGALQRRAT